MPSTERSYKLCAAVTLACSAVLSGGGGGGVESFLLQDASTNVNSKLKSTALLKNLKLIVLNVMIFDFECEKIG